MEDDDLGLSDFAKAALAEFYKEQANKEQEAEERIKQGNIDIDLFKEDWQLSQFWVFQKSIF
jgi:hypothetical protein